MATNPTKEILQRMMTEQVGGGASEAQATVDPQLDVIAKKMALLKGKPEDKYQIFVQLLPQILQSFGAPQEGAGPTDQNYEIVNGLQGAFRRGGY